MPTWSIRLLGQEEITRTGSGSLDLPDIWWPLCSSLLAAPRGQMSRSKLAGRLWPDKSEKAARHCLATALWRISKGLPRDQDLISFDSVAVGLRLQGAVWVDQMAFEQRARFYAAGPAALAQPQHRERLRRALGHYRGPFMAERDQEWVATERERLRSLYLDAMFTLASAEIAAERWTDARETARRICAEEPLREDAQRLLMTAHVRCGARAMALEQYRALVGLLQAELGIAPMAQTQALAAEIAGQPAAPAPARPGRKAAIHTARDHLHRSLALIDGYLND